MKIKGKLHAQQFAHGCSSLTAPLSEERWRGTSKPSGCPGQQGGPSLSLFQALWGCLIASRQGPEQSEALLEAPWSLLLRLGLLFATPQRDAEPRRVGRPEEKWSPLPSADGAHWEADQEGRGKKDRERQATAISFHHQRKWFQFYLPEA